MMRAGTIVLLLGLSMMIAGCSKCGGPFDLPRVCHDDAPSAR
jgi:hypothetical protein